MAFFPNEKANKKTGLKQLKFAAGNTAGYLMSTMQDRRRKRRAARRRNKRNYGMPF